MSASSLRVALIHATPLSIGPVAAAFADLWPEAATFNVLDDSLAPDRGRGDVPDGVMRERFAMLTRYALRCGAAGVLFTCSAFGTEIEAAREGLAVPVLKPNEAVMDAAVAHGGRVALLATFAATPGPMRDELVERATRAGQALDVVTAHVAEAFDALGDGDGETHDALVVAAARNLPAVDAIVLAQFSMARARPAVAAACPGVTVLTAPHAAVAQLRRRLSA